MIKKAIDLTGIDLYSKGVIQGDDKKIRSSFSGFAGDNLVEPVPNYISTECEHIISNRNNSWIVLGRDRSGSRLSGYGGKGDTQAASIDMVVGRCGKEVRNVDKTDRQLWVDPNFKKDAARIYISQKSDIDKYFDIVPGKVGISKTKSSIGIKADAVRIISREGMKLVTGTDVKNSQGGQIMSVSGVDIIAGNDDKDLQPMVKGKNLLNALEQLSFHVDKLSGIVDAFLMSQMQFNQAAILHFHYSPFFGAPTSPSIDVLVPKGIKTQIELLIQVKKSLVAFKTNLAGYKINHLNVAGEKYICSRYNNVN